MSRTLVLGDVHGAFRALEQVFERSGLDPSRDRIISLGDLCDRWPEVDKCFDLLLEVDDRTIVLGNHDEWTAEWAIERQVNTWWFEYGGAETYASYARRAGADVPSGRDDILALADTVPDSHKAMLREMVPYHIEAVGGDGAGDGSGGDRSDPDRAARRLFTHAGWNPGTPPEQQTPRDLRMSRELWTRVRLIQMGLEREGEDDEGSPPPSSLTGFAEVYLGHTPTDWTEPRPVLEVWNLDQGAGWDGVLTLMDVETKEYWQSDPVGELYG